MTRIRLGKALTHARYAHAFEKYSHAQQTPFLKKMEKMKGMQRETNMVWNRKRNLEKKYISIIVRGK